MTRRRRTIAAVAITAAVLVTVGLGARWGDEDDDPDLHACGDHLAKTFAMCHQEAEVLAEEYREASEGGCIMLHCEEENSCTEQDALWCAPCEDMYGFPFWHNLEVAITRCSAKFGWDYSKVDKVAHAACLVDEAEQQCPTLEGTDWYARWQAALPKESMRIPYERFHR
jgi:hypothetical protein